MESVVVATFPGPAEAANALTQLRGLEDSGACTLIEAEVIERRVDGTWNVLDRAEQASHTKLASGGVIGGLVGMLGGPIGAVVGGVAGASLGGVVDSKTGPDTTGQQAAFPLKVPPGSWALVCHLDEPHPGAVKPAIDALTADATWSTPDDFEVQPPAAPSA